VGKISEKSVRFISRNGCSNFWAADMYRNIWPCLACHISAGNRDILVLFLQSIDNSDLYKFAKLQGSAVKNAPSRKGQTCPVVPISA